MLMLIYHCAYNFQLTLFCTSQLTKAPLPYPALPLTRTMATFGLGLRTEAVPTRIISQNPGGQSTSYANIQLLMLRWQTEQRLVSALPTDLYIYIHNIPAWGPNEDVMQTQWLTLIHCLRNQLLIVHNTARGCPAVTQQLFICTTQAKHIPWNVWGNISIAYIRKLNYHISNTNISIQLVLML